MRGCSAVAALLLSPAAAQAQDDTPTPAPEPPPPAEVITVEIVETAAVAEPAEIAAVVAQPFALHITAEGQYILDDQIISRTELRETVDTEEAHSRTWDIVIDPLAPNHELTSVLDLLKREEIEDIHISVMAVSLPAEETPPPPMPPGLLPMPAPRLTPTAEVRVGLAASGLGADDGPLDVAFVVRRAVVGAQGKLSDRVSVRTALNAFTSHGTSTYTVTDDDGVEVGAVEVEDSPSGFTLRVRDAWADIQLDEDSRYTLKVGIQPTIFSTHTLISEPEAFYVPTMRYSGVVELAGLQGVRALGASASAALGEDKGTLTMMLSNTSSSLLEEDNTGKDLSAELLYNLGEHLTGEVSGQYGVRGADNEGAVAGLSAGFQVQRGGLDALAEYLYGFDDPNTSSGSRTPFVGVQGALGLTTDIAASAVESVRFNSHLAYFDPQAETVDADAWMLLSAGLMGRWLTDPDTAFFTGAGYEVFIPMDATKALEHRAELQVLWKH